MSDLLTSQGESPSSITSPPPPLTTSNDEPPPPPPPPPSETEITPPTATETTNHQETSTEPPPPPSQTTAQKPTPSEASSPTTTSPPPKSTQRPSTTLLPTSTITPSTSPSSIKPTLPKNHPIPPATAGTNPPSFGAVSIVAFVFAVIAAVGLFAVFICVITRRAKRRKEYATPGPSPRQPMSFKPNASSTSTTTSPFTRSKPAGPSSSVPPSFRPAPASAQNQGPYLPQFGASIRPQLVPPANSTQQALSPDLLQPGPYIAGSSVVGGNSFVGHRRMPSGGSIVQPAVDDYCRAQTDGWYANSYNMTLPPNSPYEDYLALYNGDYSLADAAYYSDYSAAARANNEDLPTCVSDATAYALNSDDRRFPVNRNPTCGNEDSYATMIDPCYVSSRPVQGYDKPLDSSPMYPPAVGGLSITNGYSSDVNSEDSDSSTGRNARVRSSGRTVNKTAAILGRSRSSPLASTDVERSEIGGASSFSSPTCTSPDSSQPADTRGRSHVPPGRGSPRRLMEGRSEHGEFPEFSRRRKRHSVRSVQGRTEPGSPVLLPTTSTRTQHER